MSNISFVKAINSALQISMEIDDKVICYGLGATDPKGIFGSTIGLAEKFGNERVFDTPTSENAMTGIGIGAAIAGYKAVMTHQRLDFFLLAMDQLVNGAAKMHYMFDGKLTVPITIRLILGRGWGQGPTHSQNLQSWFAHIPGLKVVMPSTPSDAKGLLLTSIFDPDPVLFLEHRWLHNSIGDVCEGDFRIPLGKANLINTGKDLTIVSMSYMTVEALIAQKYLEKIGISIDIIDLRTVKPIDYSCIVESLKVTKRILVLDTGVSTCSIASEIVSYIAINYSNLLNVPPSKITMPDVPEPTSFGLTKDFYPRAIQIVERVCQMLNIEGSKLIDEIPEISPHDVPGEWFKGPF